jgi:laccase
MIGEWWDLEDLGEIDRHLRHYVADNFFKASTINGKLGDLYNCSGNNQTVIR